MNHGREPPRYPTLLESPDDSFGGSKNHGKHGKAGVQPQPSVPQQEQRHDFVADDEAFVVDQLLKGKKLKALQRAADWFGTGSEDAAPVGSKSLNRNTARGSYLSRGYRAWIEWQTSRATQIRIFETLRELLMFALAAKICLFSADYTLWQLCSRYLLALAFQPFFFAIVHVYLHSQMLNCFQRHGTVGVPLAFFHHYTDPRVYGLIPYAYRYETLRAADFVMIIPFSFLVGVDQFLYLSHLHAQFLDILVHEWYHTPDEQYTSFNPLNAKFVGLLYTMKFLALLGWVDKKEHKLEHHKERAEDMHKTIDWVDWKVPIVWRLADKVGQFGFERYMRRLERVRGTRLPVDVPGLTIEDLQKERANIAKTWHFPAAVFTFLVMVVLARAMDELEARDFSVQAVVFNFNDWFWTAAWEMPLNSKPFVEAWTALSGAGETSSPLYDFFVVVDPRFLMWTLYLVHVVVEKFLKNPITDTLTFIDPGKKSGKVSFYFRFYYGECVQIDGEDEAYLRGGKDLGGKTD